MKAKKFQENFHKIQNVIVIENPPSGIVTEEKSLNENDINKNLESNENLQINNFLQENHNEKEIEFKKYSLNENDLNIENKTLNNIKPVLDIEVKTCNAISAQETKPTAEALEKKKRPVILDMNQSVYTNLNSFFDFFKNTVLRIFLGACIYLVFWAVFHHSLKFPVVCFVNNIDFCNKNEFKIKTTGILTHMLCQCIYTSIIISSILEKYENKKKVIAQLFAGMFIIGYAPPVSFIYIVYTFFGHCLTSVAIICPLLEKKARKNSMYRIYICNQLIHGCLCYLISFLFKNMEYKGILVPIVVEIAEELTFINLMFWMPKKVEEINHFHIYIFNVQLIYYNAMRMGLFIMININVKDFWTGAFMNVFVEALTRNHLHKKFLFYLTGKRFLFWKYPTVQALLKSGQKFFAEYYVIFSLTILLITNSVVYGFKTRLDYPKDEYGRWNDKKYFFNWTIIFIILTIEFIVDLITWLINLIIVNKKSMSFLNADMPNLMTIFLGLHSVIITRDMLVGIYGI